MKRDLDLVRALLLKLEGLPLRPGAMVHVEPHDDEIAVDGYDTDQIDYHLDQIEMLGFIDGGGSRPMTGIFFRRLTPAGHDYLDAVRNPETWQKTREHAEKAGGWTLSLIKDIGVSIIKSELQKHGLPLM